MTEAPRVLDVGDDVNTDDIIPARRCTNADPEHLARYAFENLLGEGRLAADYDEVRAGSNFGCGSSREHAPLALRAAGIRVVRARSFAPIFCRNAVNIGLALERLGAPTTDPVVDAIVAAGGLFAFNRTRRAGALPAVPAARRRAMTLAEKLFARACGRDFVAPGDTHFVRTDLAMCHDAVAAPMARLFHREFGDAARVADPERVVFVADHFIQTNDVRSDPDAPRLHRDMVAFAERQGCRLYDAVAPGEAAGICHVLLPEEGLVRPGMVIAGTDSHTCTYGAFGCFAVGIGTTDMANLLATGDVWLTVPPSVLVRLTGELPAGCCAKDAMLHLLGTIGCDGAAGRVAEFRGPVVDALPMDERMTLANMAVECGAVSGIVAPDAVTLEWLSRRAGAPALLAGLRSDPDAEFERVVEIDVSGLEPQVALPPRPDNVRPVSQVGDVPITRAFIGSCTGGKLFDLAQAAEVLRGRHVAPGVEMFVVPASQRVRREAERLGYWETFERAGVTLLASACGACINAGRGILGPGETGIYATNRNFQGRSGHPTSKNYLASPRLVAISAVRGRITDRLDD
ncbi:MAG TPA: aconitase/3-isopropylmalate dehydratase large subunit family protein [Candidatus Binatia bacterium]|nr:aconitase/3-isopropylmalate dehydratase large subunit family protein [Candidatus Binatia bacterium]